MTHRALVVENNVALAAALADVLADEGITATIADTPHVDGEAYDVVLMDLDTPGVLEAIPDMAERAPVVAMSASRDEWLNVAFRAGATACLPKPFGLQDLVSLVASLVRRTARAGPFTADAEALSPEDIARIRAMPKEELDRLPFGLIVLANDGTIIDYNAYESEATRYSRVSVVGMKFVDLAPCTAVKRFTGKLEEARAMPGQARTLRFFFPHRSATVRVTLRIVYDPDRDATFLIIWKRFGRAAQRARHDVPAPT